MGRRKYNKEDVIKFRNTSVGSNNYFWMILGITVIIVGTLGIWFLMAFSYIVFNYVIFYLLLFILLVLIVIGGGLIGIYYGSLQQYIYAKEHKRILEIDE